MSTFSQYYKVLYITGPIAAGKTTFSSLLLPHIKEDFYEYVNADIYYDKVFSSIDDTVARRECAKAFCNYKLAKLIHNKKSFIWEDVLCKDRKIDVLKKCHESGYYITGLFLSTEDHRVLINRSEKRNMAGWYSVPDNKIIKKYNQMLQSFDMLRYYSDEFYGIDTSTKEYRLVFIEKNKSIVEIHPCNWLKRVL